MIKLLKVEVQALLNRIIITVLNDNVEEKVYVDLIDTGVTVSTDMNSEYVSLVSDD